MVSHVSGGARPTVRRLPAIRSDMYAPKPNAHPGGKTPSVAPVTSIQSLKAKSTSGCAANARTTVSSASGSSSSSWSSSTRTSASQSAVTAALLAPTEPAISGRRWIFTRPAASSEPARRSRCSLVPPDAETSSTTHSHSALV